MGVLTVSQNSENLDMKYHQQAAAIWKIQTRRYKNTEVVIYELIVKQESRHFL